MFSAPTCVQNPGCCLREALCPLASGIRPKGVTEEAQLSLIWIDADVPFLWVIGGTAFPISFLVACFDSSNPGLCDI